MPKLPRVGDRPDPKKYVSGLKEAADLLGMSPRTLREWKHDGLIHPTKAGRWWLLGIWRVCEEKEAERERQLLESSIGGNSPALERLRNAQADRAEMERDRIKGLLVEKAVGEEETLSKCQFLSAALDFFARAVTERVQLKGAIEAKAMPVLEREIQAEVEDLKSFLSQPPENGDEDRE